MSVSKVNRISAGVLCRYDVETGRQVRSFAGHRDRITDLGISADGKWLLSSSLDGTLRIWDIPAARTLQVRGVRGRFWGLKLQYMTF